MPKSTPLTLRAFAQMALGIALFSLPFNRFVLLWQDPDLIQTRLNPYTTFGLYFSEFFILIAFFLALGDFKFSAFHRNVIVAFSFLTVLSLLFSADPWTSILFGLHLVFLVLLFLLLRIEILSRVEACKIFLASLLFQSFLGLVQFLTQSSLGLKFLFGESVLSADIPGIARASFLGDEWIRAYGTLPHPNVLGGYLFFGLVLIVFNSVTLKKIWKSIFFAILGLSFILTFSQSAWIAALVSFAITQKIKPWVFIGFFSLGFAYIATQWNIFWRDEAVQERLFYTQISLEMLWHHPFGIGFHQFTARMQEFSDAKLQPWQFQPAHNVYLLLANELGIFSLIAFLMGWLSLLKTFFQNKAFLAMGIGLSVIGLFDHYLTSLYPGLALGLVSMTILSLPQRAA